MGLEEPARSPCIQEACTPASRPAGLAWERWSGTAESYRSRSRHCGSRRAGDYRPGFLEVFNDCERSIGKCPVTLLTVRSLLRELIKRMTRPKYLSFVRVCSEFLRLD